MRVKDAMKRSGLSRTFWVIYARREKLKKDARGWFIISETEYEKALSIKVRRTPHAAGKLTNVRFWTTIEPEKLDKLKAIARERNMTTAYLINTILTEFLHESV